MLTAVIPVYNISIFYVLGMLMRKCAACECVSNMAYGPAVVSKSCSIDRASGSFRKRSNYAQRCPT